MLEEKVFLDSFSRLKDYCEREKFKGWDPFDGLNSKVFRCIPGLKSWAFARLCVIQGFKRCPVNLRRLLLVPKEYNPKGIGLALQAYCNMYRLVESDKGLARQLGNIESIKTRIEELAELLLSLRSNGYHGTCWGYNFDWQSRLEMFFPKGTPTVVCTAFCIRPLIEAGEIMGRQDWIDIGVSAAEFVVHDLHRTKVDGGFLFSYSPLNGHDTVYNASLLGSEILLMAYKYNKREEYLDLARQSIEACCKGQQDNGAWAYGTLPTQQWVDSFHTGYNLDVLALYEDVTGRMEFHKYLEKGFDYYVKTFFTNEGMPCYYDKSAYPIDIHCPAQLMVTLYRLNAYKQCGDVAGRVMEWTIRNMQHESGYFYYQLKRHLSSKISYMRWSNAFMLYGMSYYMLGMYDKTKNTKQWIE